MCVLVDCHSASSAIVWKIVPLCLLWCLWQEKNDRSFEDSERIDFKGY